MRPSLMCYTKDKENFAIEDSIIHDCDSCKTFAANEKCRFSLVVAIRHGRGKKLTTSINC